MTYTLLEMMDGRWLEGHVFSHIPYRNTFIKDLAFLLDELHQNSYSAKYKPFSMFDIVRNLVPIGDKYINKYIRRFIKDTISEFKEIESELTGSVLLHGDLHRNNIIVDSNENLQGLIDWKHICIGDPHWEFRKVRTFVGWQGLEEFLSFYNGNCNLEYIKILDRVSLCNSLQLRLQPNWEFPNRFHPNLEHHPIHGSPDTAQLYEKYIRNWPNDIY
tara:strand:- start:65 stop:715 length:651 start_codon:yes stop_codon:yes gene_type:complete